MSNELTAFHSLYIKAAMRAAVLELTSIEKAIMYEANTMQKHLVEVREAKQLPTDRVIAALQCINKYLAGFINDTTDLFEDDGRLNSAYYTIMLGCSDHLIPLAKRGTRNSNAYIILNGINPNKHKLGGRFNGNQ